MIFIITTILSLWLSAAIIVEARNKAIRKTSMWKVSKKFPDKQLRGQIVKITQDDPSEVMFASVNPIVYREKVQDDTAFRNKLQALYNQNQYDPLGSLVSQQEMNKLRTMYPPRWRYEENSEIIEGKVAQKKFNTYLKQVKSLQEKKGGEKNVRRMPRLWILLIIYVPLAILVWDIVMHVNGIAAFVVDHFVLVHK